MDKVNASNFATRAKDALLTINAIARKTGLSRQTVRHVLLNRFDHRASTLRRVEDAIIDAECAILAKSARNRLGG